MIYQDRHRECAAWPELRAWLDYLKIEGKSIATMEIYERRCGRMLLMFPDKPFNQFTDEDMLASLSQWGIKSRPVTKIAFNQWFKWGFRTRRLTWNPADLLPDIKIKTSRNISVFTAAEEALLRNLPYPDGQLITILLETGIRNAEARHLTVKRVLFNTQELLVTDGAKGNTKGDKDRFVPLTRAATAAFHEMILTDGLGKDDHFWAYRPGGSRPKRDHPIGGDTIFRWWHDCLEEAGVEHRKLHTTRHSFATRWLDTDDLPDTVVQRALGHDSIKTTRDIYEHRNRLKDGELMRALEAQREEASRA